MSSMIFEKKWDIKVFLILIPLINVINYYLTYEHISYDFHTILTFTIDTLEGYAAWLLVRAIIHYFDRKMPYEDGALKRVIVQTAATFFSGVIVIILLTEIVNALATNTPVPLSFYTKDIWIISIWFFVVNGIYIGVDFYHKSRLMAIENQDKIRDEAKKMLLSGFKVKLGKTEVILPYDEIIAFFTEDKYVVCTTIREKKYLIDYSIDKIETELPDILFFRLNRQFLVHRHMIEGYQRIENGKVNVLIRESAGIQQTITVSRTKAAEFKNWLRP